MYSIWYYSMVRLCCFCSPDQHPTYTSVIRPLPALLLSCTFTAPFHALVKQTDRTVEHFMYVLWAQLVWTCQTQSVSAGLSLTPPDCKSCTKVLYCWLKSSYQCSVLIHFIHTHAIIFLITHCKKAGISHWDSEKLNRYQKTSSKQSTEKFKQKPAEM